MSLFSMSEGGKSNPNTKKSLDRMAAATDLKKR